MRGKNILATGEELPSTAELDMALLASQSQVHREEISEDRVIDVNANPQCKRGVCEIPKN